MEERTMNNNTDEEGVISKKELKKAKRLFSRAKKHLKIAIHYRTLDISRLTELENIVRDHPVVLEKYNEIAQKQSDLIQEFNETGNPKLLKKVKRLSKTIPSFDDTNKVDDKKLKKMFKRLVKLRAEVKKHEEIIEYHTKRHEELIAIDPRIEELLKDRTETYNEVFEMD